MNSVLAICCLWRYSERLPTIRERVHIERDQRDADPLRNLLCTPQICINIHPDAVPPNHAVSYHVATDKVLAQNGDNLRSIFSDNIQPIATRGKKARGTLLVDKHCGNGRSIKRALLSVSY